MARTRSNLNLKVILEVKKALGLRSYLKRFYNSTGRLYIQPVCPDFF